MFKVATGARLEFPTRRAPAVADLLGGHIDVMFSDILPACRTSARGACVRWA